MNIVHTHDSGWVEKVCSYLEMVCQTSRNRMEIGNIKRLFF